MSENSNDTTAAVDAARALITTATEAWTGSITEERQAVEACAVATYAALPHIGDHDGALYANVDEYRALFVSRQADKDGNYGPVSKSTVTAWGRLGHAHSVGVTPESDRQTWTRLQSKVNADARMRDAVDGKDGKAVTGPKIRKAVASCYKSGKYVPAPKPGAAGSGSEPEAGATGANPDASVPTVPASVSGMLDLLETLTARLASEPITPAEFARLASTVEALGSITSSPVEEVEAARKAS